VPAGQRATGRRALAHRVATRRPRKTIWVFCEGVRTEPEYLEALKRQKAVRDVAAVDVRIVPGRGSPVPVALVDRAVSARSRACGEEAEVDEVWCVFDVEQPQSHPRLVEAANRPVAGASR